MQYSWEQLGEDRDASYLLTVQGKRKAVAWFHGGFVERPDSWQLMLRGDRDSRGYETLAAAKRAAEEEFVK